MTITDAFVKHQVRLVRKAVVLTSDTLGDFYCFCAANFASVSVICGYHKHECHNSRGRYPVWNFSQQLPLLPRFAEDSWFVLRLLNRCSRPWQITVRFIIILSTGSCPHFPSQMHTSLVVVLLDLDDVFRLIKLFHVMISFFLSCASLGGGCIPCGESVTRLLVSELFSLSRL